MAELNPTVQAQLAEWAEKNKGQVDSQQVPLDGQTVAPEPPEAQVTPAAEEVQTEQEPKAEETPTEVEETPKPWDADNNAEPIKVEPPSTFDFNKIGSALGWGEIKDESDFLAKASEVKTKLKTLEEAPLQGIPEDLREVIDVAKKSGESWKEYLSNQIVDFSKIDPVVLFQQEFDKDAVKDPKYFVDGKFSQELADQALDAIPEAVQKQFGYQIQQGYINTQRQRQAQIKAKAEAKIAEAENTLAKATQNLSEILPFDNYGIKFEPRHSAEIYSGITNSTLIKKHLGPGVTYDKLVESGADMKAIARTITLAEKGEKMIKYKSETAEARAKKAILDKTQNAQLNNPGTQIKPENPEAKVLSPAELLAAHLAKQRKTGL